MDALSSPSQLWKVTGAQSNKTRFLYTSALLFIPAAAATSLTTVIIMNRCGANPEVPARSSQRATLHSFRVRLVLLPPERRGLRFPSLLKTLFRVSIFEMCVTCFFVFFPCVDFKRARDAASHFHSSASAMARFSPICVKADNWRGKKKKKKERERGLNARAD